MDARFSTTGVVASLVAMEPAQEEAEAMSPKPSLDEASGSCEPMRRTPTCCTPSAVLGEWRTGYGVYSISLNDRRELDFQEDNLHGILRLEGEWFTAVIHDSSTQADEVFGHLRLRREGEVIRSYFKDRAEDAWEASGAIEATPLPYLRVGARAAAEAEGAGGRPWEQTTCCICFEALDDGEDFAELRCHHIYHRSCIRTWFVHNGSCPMRCAHP